MRKIGETMNGTAGAAIKRALALVTEALDLLDAHGGPPDAAAHLDLAMRRLREVLASGK